MPVQLPVRNDLESKNVESHKGNSSTPPPAPSIVDAIPLPLVLWLASPYLAGRTAEDAIKKAHEIYRQNRFSSTVDILGEDAANAEDCDNYTAAYKRMIDLVSSSPIPCRRPQEQMTISFKPSMFSTVVPNAPVANRDAELSNAYARIKSVVDYAKKKNVNMTLEAEDRNWTDFHLDTYFSLLNEGYSNLGTVIQSRLFRTKSDLRRFDERARVRLVIGIYQEPAEIALTQKPEMKERLLDFAAELCARGTYIELATHDSDTLGKFFQRVAIPQKVPATQFETQYLLGVPRYELQRDLVSGKYFSQLAQNTSTTAHDYLSDLARSGVLVRMYLPYGKDAVAGPYCKRRLKANPNMFAYGIKNFFHIK